MGRQWQAIVLPALANNKPTFANNEPAFVRKSTSLQPALCQQLRVSDGNPTFYQLSSTICQQKTSVYP